MAFSFVLFTFLLCRSKLITVWKRVMQIKIAIMIFFFLEWFMRDAFCNIRSKGLETCSGASLCLTPHGRRELQGGGCRPPCPSPGPDRPKRTNTMLMMISTVSPLVISHMRRSPVKRVEWSVAQSWGREHKWGRLFCRQGHKTFQRMMFFCSFLNQLLTTSCYRQMLKIWNTVFTFFFFNSKFPLQKKHFFKHNLFYDLENRIKKCVILKFTWQRTDHWGQALVE